VTGTRPHDEVIDTSGPEASYEVIDTSGPEASYEVIDTSKSLVISAASGQRPAT
jgi:hypothetical protein